MSGSYDRRVRLIDASTGKCDRTIQGMQDLSAVFMCQKRGELCSVVAMTLQ